jgi:cleavage and polyadenylation specificity factor subunit 2
MLRVTPLYGSQYNDSGEAEAPTCTLIEFSHCRCLLNLGYHPQYWSSSSSNSRNTTKDVQSNEKKLVKKNKLNPITVPLHDCVLLMNSTWQCIGSLPMYYEYMQELYHNGTISTIPPIYATYPTIKMGQMTLYEYHATLAYDGIHPLPYTLSSIDNVVASILPIKFNQHIYISPSFTSSYSSNTTDDDNNNNSNQTSATKQPKVQGQQLSITAHRAGYVVGGAYYALQRLMDETIVIYTDSTYHMSKELHLEACTLLQTTASVSSASTSISVLPDVLITRPGGPSFRQFRALYTNQNSSNSNNGSITKHQQNQDGMKHKKNTASVLQQPLVQQAERNLIESIMAVLRRDGNVLIPTDTSGRVLELLLLLHNEWDKHKYASSYNLICYSYMGHQVIEYAKSQLEWMGHHCNLQFADHGLHPYRFATATSSSTSSFGSGRQLQKHTIYFCTSLQELNTILEDTNQNPSCILASGLSLEGGPSRDVLLKFADNPDNAILFTDSSQSYLRQTFYSATTSTTTDDNDTVGRATNMTATSASITTTTLEGTTPNGSTVSYLGISANDELKSSGHHPGDTTNAPGTFVDSTHTMNDATITTVPNPTSKTKISSSTNPSTIPTMVDPTENDMTENDDNNDDVTDIGEALDLQESKSVWTTAGQLLQAWAMAKATGTEMADSVIIDVNVPIRTTLSGMELKVFLEQEESKRQAYRKAAEKRAMLAQVELAKGQLHLGEDDVVPPSTTSSMSTDIATSTTTKATSGVSSSSSTAVASRGRPKKTSRFDSTLFLKFSKPLYSTFC